MEIFRTMELNDKEFKELFNSKNRLNCSGCGGTEFRITKTGIPKATIEEAVFMHCKKCGHRRLELM